MILGANSLPCASLSPSVKGDHKWGHLQRAVGGSKQVNAVFKLCQEHCKCLKHVSCYYTQLCSSGKETEGPTRRDRARFISYQDSRGFSLVCVYVCYCSFQNEQNLPDSVTLFSPSPVTKLQQSCLQTEKGWPQLSTHLPCKTLC